MTTSKLFIYALLVAPVLAQTAFDGTWRLNLEQTVQSSPPRPLVFWVNNGVYDCSSCPGPNIHIEADGQVHPISGWPFDAESVSVVDPRTITTFKSTEYPPDGNRPITSGATFRKVGNGPAGSHATSGSWSVNMTGIKTTENGWWTFKLTGDRITMFSGTGGGWDAKLDGKDYPVKGSNYSNSISLKRIDDQTIEITHKRDGQIVSITKMIVSPDGRRMTLVTTPKPAGETTTAIAEKQ